MLGCSRLINLIFTILLLGLLGVVTWSAIYTKATVELISDREMVKEWMREEKGQTAFLNYLVESTYTDDSSLLLENILTKDEYAQLVDDKISDEELGKLTDSSIDRIYDWLEGEEETPSINLLDQESGIDLGFIDAILEEKIGDLSDVIDSRDLIYLTSKLDFFDAEELDLANLPSLYSSFLKLPEKLIIAGIILSIIVVLSVRSLRSGLLLVGGTIAFAASTILFEGSSQLVAQVIYSDLFPIDIPTFDQLPTFINTLWDIASGDITELARKYAIFVMIGSAVVAIGSQLAISESTEKDEDDDEDDDE